MGVSARWVLLLIGLFACAAGCRRQDGCESSPEACEAPADGGPPSVCSDGLVQADIGEVCDDGNAHTEPACFPGSDKCTRCNADCSAVLHLAPLPFTRAVAAGDRYSLASLGDGTVQGWGGKEEGLLGDGAGPRRMASEPVVGLTGVTALSAGGSHALAARQDGTVWTWGLNAEGTGSPWTAPAQVQGLTDIVGVAAGAVHNVALGQDGTVWAWGDNGDGQLGDTTRVSRPIPVRASVNDVSAIAAGPYHTVALRKGVVLVWGRNYFGPMENPPEPSSPTPHTVLSMHHGFGESLRGVTAIAAGGLHSVALHHDGLVFAWGDNTRNQLGDGTSWSRFDAVQVPGLRNIAAIAAGTFHSVALRADGTVWTWGFSGDGRLGRAEPLGGGPAAQVEGLTQVIAIAAGESHTLALRADGTVWAWGLNRHGQLGDGTWTSSQVPVQVMGLRP